MTEAGTDAVEVTLIDAVREALAQVCDRHIDIKLCRELFGAEGTARAGAFGMASHLAFDVRSALLDDNARVAAAMAAIQSLSTRTEELAACLFDLALSAGKLNVALDGQERYRRLREDVTDKMGNAAAALASHCGEQPS